MRSVSTTLINTLIDLYGCVWSSRFSVFMGGRVWSSRFSVSVRCVEPLRDLEPFSRVSRVHPLLIAPRDVRFRRDFSIAPSLTQGAAQKLRCALSPTTDANGWCL